MFKNYLLIIVFAPLLLHAQEKKKTLLVVSLLKKNVDIRGDAWRSIRYNNVSEDSAANYIYETTNGQVKAVFSNYTLHFISEYISNSTLDSSYSLKLRIRFYYEQKDSSFHLDTVKSNDSNHRNYYGCELNEKGTGALKKAIEDSKCDYVLFINQFEIINPNSTFSLSCELMDKNMKKIYGDKNEWKKEVFKTMYFDVLKSYLKQAEEDMLKKVKGYFKDDSKPASYPSTSPVRKK